MPNLSHSRAAPRAALIEQGQRAAFLSRLSALLNASLDSHETLRRVADLTVPELGDACGIHVIERDGNVRLIAVRHIDPALQHDTEILASRPAGPRARGWAHVLRDGVSDLMAEATPDATRAAVPDPAHRASLDRVGLTSQISVPLRARGRVLGALTLALGRGKRRYGVDDLRFAEDVASIAALAVDNARLYEETREREVEAHAARERAAFLADLTGLVASSLDYDETVRTAARMVLPRLGDYCSVVIVDSAGRLRQIAWAHVDRDREPLLRRVGEALFEGGEQFTSLAALSIRSQVTQVVARVDLDALTSRYPSRVAELVRELAPCSLVSVPLRARGRTIGALNFNYAESQRTYTDEDVQMAEEIGRRVALAVENARLFAESQESNRAKDEFLATLSHELRTPLTAILGWAHMLRTGEIRDAVKERAIESIEQNARAQARLVEDLLDVARAIAGKVELECRPCDLAALAIDACDAIEPAARVAGVTLACDAGSAVPLNADAARLRQVLDNLLSNAIKFSVSGGHVRLTVRPTGDEVVVEIADDGVGIPAGFLPYVFDRFRQADPSVTRRHGGLGIGLAIVRQVIELHGGTITAASDGEGRGARFTIRLPAMPADCAAAPAR